MCSLVLLLTFSSQLLASYNRCLPSLLAFTCLYLTYICSLTETMSRKFVKFQEFGESRFGGSEKDCYFLKILKWQHKLVRDYKRGKLVSYFLKNAAKTSLYWLKISGNNEIEHIFQSVFISVVISTQIASASLKENMHRSQLFKIKCG